MHNEKVTLKRLNLKVMSNKFPNRGRDQAQTIRTDPTILLLSFLLTFKGEEHKTEFMRLLIDLLILTGCIRTMSFLTTVFHPNM
jgi:hypothetical protein